MRLIRDEIIRTFVDFLRQSIARQPANRISKSTNYVAAYQSLQQVHPLSNSQPIASASQLRGSQPIAPANPPIIQQPAIASASPPTMWQPASRISNSTNYVAASQPHYGTASPPTTRQPANRIWPYQISLDLTKPYHITSGCIGLQTSIIPSTFIRSHQIWLNLIKSHQVLLNRSACVFGRSLACFGSVRGSAELHDAGPAVFAQRRHFSRWCWNTAPVPVFEPPRAEKIGTSLLPACNYRRALNVPREGHL